MIVLNLMLPLPRFPDGPSNRASQVGPGAQGSPRRTGSGPAGSNVASIAPAFNASPFAPEKWGFRLTRSRAACSSRPGVRLRSERFDWLRTGPDDTATSEGMDGPFRLIAGQGSLAASSHTRSVGRERPSRGGTTGIQGSSYDIEGVEGIGKVYGKALRDIGIETTVDLLRKCGDPAGRAAAAAQLGYQESLLVTWTCIADLMRVPGIGEEFSELIEAAGIKTVPALAQCDEKRLLQDMTRINEQRNMSGTLPTEAQVAAWKARAKEMDPAVVL